MDLKNLTGKTLNVTVSSIEVKNITFKSDDYDIMKERNNPNSKFNIVPKELVIDNAPS